MSLKLHLIIFSTFLVLLSCKKKQTDLEFEQSVAYEIFPILLDSVHTDRRLTPDLPIPPPPPLNWEETDSIDNNFKINDSSVFIAAFDKRKLELEKDTTKLVVAIVDSTYRIDERAKKELIDFYKEYAIDLDTIKNDIPYRINISDLKHHKKFKLKYRSELPATSKVWKENYNFYLSGITGFSRIQFDLTKNYGVLLSGFGCGRLCGFSGLVFIRKVNGKWIIDKIKITSIS